MTKLLDQINFPADLRKFEKSKLKQISDELRNELIDVVSETGGHLGAGLGVVELTVALHYVFNTPKDKLVWDVGHQSYPHKIITGRKDKIKTLRQGRGLSGFTKRSESEYDPFGAAHSSTSISSTLGMAVAKKLSNDNNNVIAIIGDGAMSAGMAYEAMNNAGALKSKLIVVLNDNDMSIARPVGAMSKYLPKLLSGKIYFSLRETIKLIISAFSKRFSQKAGKAEDILRGIVTGGTLFSELGFYYVGPIDGHDVNNLVTILENVKNFKGHDRGNTYSVVKETLNSLNYSVYTKIVNTSEYTSIPQNRERTFMVCFYKEPSWSKYQLDEYDENLFDKKDLQKVKMQCPKTFRYHKSFTNLKKQKKNGIWDYLTPANKVDDKYFYTKEKYPKAFYAIDKEVEKKNTMYQYRRVYIRENKSNECPTLTANMGTGGHNVPIVLVNKKKKRYRKLTPEECFKLQGYVNFSLPKNVANGQLYKQAGNSVTVPLIEIFAGLIKSAIDK